MGPDAIDPVAFQRFEQVGWERKAHGYHMMYAPIAGYVVGPLLDAAGVEPAVRTLDIGSGPGYVAARAAERGARVVGLDFSEAMVRLACQLHPGLRFEVGDAQDLPFPPSSFDAVVGNFVLHHLPEQARALAGFARALVPGGRVALTVWDEPAKCRLLGIFVDSANEAGAPLPPSLPAGPPMSTSDAAYAILLRTTGFAKPKVKTITYACRFDTPDTLWDGFLGASVRIAALITEQPPEVRKRIREAFDRLIASYVTVRGLEIPVSVKLVSGAVSQ